MRESFFKKLNQETLKTIGHVDIHRPLHEQSQHRVFYFQKCLEFNNDEGKAWEALKEKIIEEESKSWQKGK